VVTTIHSHQSLSSVMFLDSRFSLRWGHSCAVVALLGLCTFSILFCFILLTHTRTHTLATTTTTTVGVSPAVSFQKKK